MSANDHLRPLAPDVHRAKVAAEEAQQFERFIFHCDVQLAVHLQGCNRPRQSLVRGTLHSCANSPAPSLPINSANPLSVMYCLPAILIVRSQPFRRQRHAVVSEIPASRQNLCRLMMGLPSGLMVDVVFMRQLSIADVALPLSGIPRRLRPGQSLLHPFHNHFAAYHNGFLSIVGIFPAAFARDYVEAQKR